MESHDLNLGDEIYAIGSLTGVYEDTIDEMRLDLIAVDKVKKGDVFSFKSKSLLRRNDKIYKLIAVEEIL